MIKKRRSVTDGGHLLRRVSEAENFFRCNICGGYLDARDYVWVLDHEGPLPPRSGSAAVAQQIISARP
jgi:hypothetical protein